MFTGRSKAIILITIITIYCPTRLSRKKWKQFLRAHDYERSHACYTCIQARELQRSCHSFHIQIKDSSQNHGIELLVGTRQLILRQLIPMYLHWDQLSHFHPKSATTDPTTIDPIYFQGQKVTLKSPFRTFLLSPILFLIRMNQKNISSSTLFALEIETTGKIIIKLRF